MALQHVGILPYHFMVLKPRRPQLRRGVYQSRRVR